MWGLEELGALNLRRFSALGWELRFTAVLNLSSWSHNFDKGWLWEENQQTFISSLLPIWYSCPSKPQITPQMQLRQRRAALGPFSRGMNGIPGVVWLIPLQSQFPSSLPVPVNQMQIAPSGVGWSVIDNRLSAASAGLLVFAKSSSNLYIVVLPQLSALQDSHYCQLCFKDKAQLLGNVVKGFPKVVWIWDWVKFAEVKGFLQPSN